MSRDLSVDADKIIAALERIATALEQSVLEHIDEPQDPYGANLEPADEIADLPALRGPIPPPATEPPPSKPAGNCPVHHTDWKLVPAGYSQKKQKAYNSFWACATPGCNQRPAR